MSFLNSVLERQKGEEIIDVVFNDPHNTAETIDLKKTIVDVRCTDQLNNQYIIEMQIMTQEDYAARAQYYSSVALARQLEKKAQYGKLVPVIFVGVLNFNLFENTNYLSHHLILDTETHQQNLKHLTFHFIELTKFHKKLEELSTILDKWIYFLRYADELKKIPMTLKEPIISDAFEIIEHGNWSVKELETYDRYLDAFRVIEGQVDSAKRAGLAEGITKGERKKAIEIAQKLLDVLDIETIAKKTGLTSFEIKKLKKQ